MYTSEQILIRCPEKWNNHILLEWTIREANVRIGYLLHLVGSLDIISLEKIRDDLALNGNSQALRKHLKTTYYIDCQLVNFVLKCLKLPFEIDENEINQENIALLELLIRQQDVIKHAISSKIVVSENTSKDKSTLDIYDTITEIIQLRLLDSLTLSNYKDTLTYRQLDFYAKKASNYHKKQMLQFYEPFLHGLSMAFAKKEDKIPDFRKMLFIETEEKRMNKYELNRKIWFHDKWDDDKFVRERSDELGFELDLFFPEESKEDNS